MAETINTNVVFIGEKENLLKLKNFIVQLQEDSGIKTSFEEAWIGHIAYNLCLKKGMSPSKSAEAVVVNALEFSGCRGRVESIDDYSHLSPSHLLVRLETKGESAVAIFEELLLLSKIENVDLYWLNFYEDCSAETNDSEQVFFKWSYYLDHDSDFDSEFTKETSDCGCYTEEETKDIFIKLLTSKFVSEDERLSKEDAESMDILELLNCVDSAEFYDEDEEIYLSVKPVSYV